MPDTGYVQRTRAYRDLANGQERMHNLDRFGNLTNRPFMQNAVDNGNVHVAQIGSATTPVSLAKTTYDADQPQMVIDVPAGTGIMPIYLAVELEDAAGTDTEIIWSVSDGLIGAGTSTAVTPANAKVSAGGSDPASACSVYSLYTGNGTAPSNGYEFYRDVRAFAQEADAPSDKREWTQAVTGFAPIIEGTGALVLHAAAATTAPAGYVIAVWFEYTV